MPWTPGNPSQRKNSVRKKCVLRLSLLRSRHQAPRMAHWTYPPRLAVHSSRPVLGPPAPSQGSCRQLARLPPPPTASWPTDHLWCTSRVLIPTLNSSSHINSNSSNNLGGAPRHPRTSRSRGRTRNSRGLTRSSNSSHTRSSSSSPMECRHPTATAHPCPPMHRHHHRAAGRKHCWSAAATPAHPRPSTAASTTSRCALQLLQLLLLQANACPSQSQVQQSTAAAVCPWRGHQSRTTNPHTPTCTQTPATP